MKFKNYPFWRIDKQKNLQIIDNGGWHFAYLQDVKNISKKIKSFAHGEFNKEDIVSEKNIELRINQGEDVTKKFATQEREIVHKLDIDKFPQPSIFLIFS